MKRDSKMNRSSRVIRDQLIPSLRRQTVRRKNQRAGAHDTHAPANGAKDPGLVKLPTDEESRFVVEEVCL
jgi:hypothetical protein